MTAEEPAPADIEILEYVPGSGSTDDKHPRRPNQVRINGHIVRTPPGSDCIRVHDMVYGGPTSSDDQDHDIVTVTLTLLARRVRIERRTTEQDGKP